jgi:hypothetical protein
MHLQIAGPAQRHHRWQVVWQPLSPPPPPLPPHPMPLLQHLRLFLRTVNGVIAKHLDQTLGWSQTLTCDVIFGIERCGFLTQPGK